MNDLYEKEILLVDDEVIIGMDTKNSLEKYGYTVVTVPSADLAMNIVYRNKNLALILMDIDLGRGSNGIELAKRILEYIEIPIVFVSSHTEPEVVSMTEEVTSYGYIEKYSNLTVYDASIKMAYKLFNEKQKVEIFDQYLKFALNYEESPIFISNELGNVVFCNKSYLNIIGKESQLEASEFASYSSFVKVFSYSGNLLDEDDWASTRALRGLSNEDEIFFVYNSKLKQIQVNYYTYAPIYNGNMRIIGSYVKIGKRIVDPDKSIISKIKSFI